MSIYRSRRKPSLMDRFERGFDRVCNRIERAPDCMFDRVDRMYDKIDRGFDRLDRFADKLLTPKR